MAEHVAADPLPLAEPPEVALDEVLDIGGMLIAQGQALVEAMFRTWNLYQLLIALGLFAVAHLMRAVLGPRIRAWMAARENWPKWRIRILVEKGRSDQPDGETANCKDIRQPKVPRRGTTEA